MKILVVGGTGFVGRHLIRALLDRGDSVEVMSRSPNAATTTFGNRVRGVSYDSPIEGYDAVVNLAGAGIADKRWTSDRKRELLDSRTKTTAAIVRAIAASRAKPSVLVNASAIGYYGDRLDEELDEGSRPGIGFLPETCVAWEREAEAVSASGTRLVLLRIGIVLGDGGALKKMIPPFKAFVGGKLGSGRQWMSWIHVDDLVKLIIYCIANPTLKGPVNGTAPAPVTNDQFSKALGKVLGRPSFAPVPGFALKLMLGEMAGMLLGGQKVLPKAALRNGFVFEHPTLEAALDAVIND